MYQLDHDGRSQDINQVAPAEPDHKRKEYVELFLQRERPVHKAGAIGEVAPGCGKAKIGHLQNAGYGGFEIGPKAAEYAG